MIFKTSLIASLLVLTFNTKLLAKSTSLSFVQKNLKVQKIDELRSYDKDYHTVKEIIFTEVAPKVLYTEKNDPFGSIGDIVKVIDQLIATGKKIWAIIKAGKPSINASYTPISVIPKGDDPDDIFNNMYGWSAPVIKTYLVEYKNLYGMNVISFKFTFYFQHSGTNDGAGKYLTGINVVPNSIDVMWGYSFDSTSKLITISNRGTREAPIGAATIQLDYKSKSAFKEIDSSITFHITGIGELIKY